MAIGVTKVYQYTWNTLVDYGRLDRQKAEEEFDEVPPEAHQSVFDEF